MEGIRDIVHEETQSTDEGFDLTVASVYAVEEAGRVDFGGGELEDAELAPVETQKRNEDDDYGWWSLEPGTYVVEHNESLDTEEPVTVLRAPPFWERGAYHPTVRVSRTLPFCRLPSAARVYESRRTRVYRRSWKADFA